MKPLRENTFFSAFEARAVEQLLVAAEQRHYAPGERIFFENDPADAVYLVVSGMVQLEKSLAGSKTLPIARIGEGDYFGEIGVLDDSRRSTGAIAEGPAELARIPGEPFLQVLKKEPTIVTIHLLHRIFDALRSTNDRYVSALVHKEKMQFVGEMANAIIHDFKNPLTGIQLAAQFLRMSPDDKDRNKWCDVIEQQVQRMVDMAHELLEFARGQPKLNPQPVNLGELFARFDLLNGEFIRQSHSQLKLAPADLVVAIDADKMLRVLQNLVGNAVDAMQPKGGIIRVKAHRHNGRAVIEVSDNGPGIPVSIRETFFEPFVTFGKKYGTGLGSAIAKTLVEAHGGTIRFETATGDGTCFFIELPLPA